MGTRGRKSVNDLAASETVTAIAIPRARVPSELSNEQAQVWRDVVNQMPAEWFSKENLPLLVQYCRHVVSARKVGQLLDKLYTTDAFDVKKYRDLSQIQREESRAIAMLGRSMRLTQQTHYDEKKVIKKKASPPPWEMK